MKTDKRGYVYLTPKEAKKFIMESLKLAFPGVKFSMRKERAGVYNAYYVDWKPSKDGKSPSREQVFRFLERFETLKPDYPNSDGLTYVELEYEALINGEWRKVYWPIDTLAVIGRGEGMKMSSDWKEKAPIRVYKPVKGAQGVEYVPYD